MHIPAMSRLFTAVLALALTALTSAAVPPAEKLLPADTLAVITVPDAAKLRTLSQTSPAGQLWNDPALRPIKEKFLNRLNEELLGPLERELGIKLGDYAALAQGQVTLALTQNGWAGNPGEQIGALLLVDAKDNQKDLAQALTDFRKKWTDAGKTLRTETVRGTEFLVVSLTTNDVPATLRKLLPGPSGVREFKRDAEEPAADEADAKPAKPMQLFVGRLDSLLVIGNTLTAVERVAGQLGDSGAAPLADVAHFQSCQAQFFRTAHTFGWLNAQAAMDALLKVSARKEKAAEDAPDPLATMRPEKILRAAGLTGLRSAAFAIEETPEGTLVALHLGAPEAERAGLLKILAGEPRETTPPPFVPADVVKFSRWRVDGQKTWSTLTAAFNQISPAIMGTVDFMLGTAEAAAKQGDEKFDLKRQLIGNLGDDVISYEKKPKGTTLAELAAPPQLTLIGAKNADEMTAAIKVVLGALGGGKGGTEREFLGRRIFTVTLPGRPAADPDAPKPGRFLLSSSGGYVLLGTDEALLEEYLRAGETPPKALRETPGLTEALARVTTPGTSLAGFQNQLEMQRTAFELLRRLPGGNTNDTETGLTPVPESFGLALPEQSLKAWVDFSLLPPFSALEKYFHFAVFGGGADAEGLTLKFFTPTPPALKQ